MSPREWGVSAPFEAPQRQTQSKSMPVSLYTRQLSATFPASPASPYMQHIRVLLRLGQCYSNPCDVHCHPGRSRPSPGNLGMQAGAGVAKTAGCLAAHPSSAIQGTCLADVHFIHGVGGGPVRRAVRAGATSATVVAVHPAASISPYKSALWQVSVLSSQVSSVGDICCICTSCTRTISSENIKFAAAGCTGAHEREVEVGARARPTAARVCSRGPAGLSRQPTAAAV